MMIWTLLFSPVMAETPEGWFLAGSQRDAYEADVVPEAHTGRKSARYRHIDGEKRNGFGTMMQNIDPADYAGNRIRMTAWVKSEGVKDWAGLWLRVDEGKTTHGFDNMHDRPIKGSTDWTQYAIVLDVHPDATNLAFGVLLADTGTVWIDDLEFEVVDEGVPTTGAKGAKKSYAPTNASFED